MPRFFIQGEELGRKDTAGAQRKALLLVFHQRGRGALRNGLKNPPCGLRGTCLSAEKERGEDRGK